MLIVICGASGFGKSTLAAQLQHELGWPTALLGQDHFRQTVYRERQDAGHADGMEHAALLEVALISTMTTHGTAPSRVHRAFDSRSSKETSQRSDERHVATGTST